MNGASCNSRNNFIVKAIVLFGLATIAFYLLIEHKVHLLAYSSYIFFLAYILLHFFMCGRHGGHGEHGGHSGHGSGKHKLSDTEKGVERDAEVHEYTGQHGHGEHEHDKESLK
ncbi:hypothetical protein MSHOH_3017 [Methanosarcina horonobensis HB-1 = JCM 15518]|uniref:Uncharacterized protein n=1 Tax=Methanosarcina horonobensis HB-1 = JCM 15518 TaxID=1434110 RepID=A0A0E3WWG4_9EURY|nr:DUF2933 domain-containing protein [Methanosarcina horonobensis]AKB79500.1 hypothetical protein MSHOH_3017 [Methanosarcina horonobensis HB-1 = JCM 15518]